MPTKTISLRVTAEEYEAICELCASKGLSLSEFIRAALQEATSVLQ